jgi:hypothetical protein
MSFSRKTRAIGFMTASEEIRVWKTPDGSGTPFLWSDSNPLQWGYLGTRDPRAWSPAVLSPDWLRQVFDYPRLLADLPDIFGLVIVDREHHKTLVACDRLGIQSIYYTNTADGNWLVSSQGMWLLLEAGHDGSINHDAFVSHMGFGYNIHPTPGLYSGVNRLPPGGYLVLEDTRLSTGVYWSAPELTEDLTEGAVSALKDTLRAATVETNLVDKLFLGLSAGKDSLCIASVLASDTAPLTGTLGIDGCADRLQGVALASRFGWQHPTHEVATVSEFADRVKHIAFYTAGMATASYADFVSFIDRCIPTDAAFIMGEGGECVRDFFRMEGGTFMDKLIQVYTTPIEYLRATLSPRFASALNDYPANIIQSAKTASNEFDDDAFVVHFYRYQRMYGNFGPRHDALSALRARICPFEDAHFIESTYRLKPSYYQASGVHRAIIAHARPDLLPFFDQPITSNQHVQDWQMRFVTGIGAVVRQLLVEALPLCSDIFDRDRVLTLCDANIQAPSRAIYHLLRLVSFAVARQMLRAEAVSRLAMIDQSSFTLGREVSRSGYAGDSRFPGCTTE